MLHQNLNSNLLNGCINITQESEVQAVSTWKIICAFFAIEGVLLVDFLPRGDPIHATTYCGTLRKLHHAIQNKRGMHGE